MTQKTIAIPILTQSIPNYTDALESLGARVVLLSKEAGAGELDGLNALLLPGGGDLSPSLYGQEMNGSFSPSPQLDHLQLEVLDAFVAAKKPVLGICRGHQLINVYFGGTLIQHLPTAPSHARRAPAHLHPDRIHPVQASGWVEELYGSQFLVNSSHHQAVKSLGDGLVLDALCPEDQVAEALHHTLLPIWGVQWHPERMCLGYARPDLADGLKVFSFFLEHIC